MRKVTVIMVKSRLPNYGFTCNEYPPAKFLDEGFLHIVDSDGSDHFIRSSEILRVKVETILPMKEKKSPEELS